MTTMMTNAATRTATTGGAAKFSDRVRDKFEAPLERDEMGFGPLRVAVSPPLKSGSPGDGESQNADNGAGQSSQFRQGKN